MTDALGPELIMEESSESIAPPHCTKACPTARMEATLLSSRTVRGLYEYFVCTSLYEKAIVVRHPMTRRIDIELRKLRTLTRRQ